MVHTSGDFDKQPQSIRSKESSMSYRVRLSPMFNTEMGKSEFRILGLSEISRDSFTGPFTIGTKMLLKLCSTHPKFRMFVSKLEEMPSCIIMRIRLHLKRLETLESLPKDLPPKLDNFRLRVELLLLGTMAVLNSLLHWISEKWADFLSRASILQDMEAEFPRGIPHLCTTMPWTIWLSLVVLWGVCWMFAIYCTSPEQTWPVEEYFDNSLYNCLDGMSPDSISWDSFLVAAPVIAPDINTAAARLSHVSNDPDVLVSVPPAYFDRDNIRPIESEGVASSNGGFGIVPQFSALHGHGVAAEPEANSQDATESDDIPEASSTDASKQDAAVGDAPARFVCSTCGTSYGRRASLNRHTKAKHASVTFTCSFCSKTYDRRDNMKRHEKTHNEVVQESPASGPSAPRAARRQASAATRPVGISRTPNGGRAQTRGHGQQGSAQMSPAQMQRAMQLMGELFLIMSGNNP